MWQIFREIDTFLSPWGQMAATSMYQQRLPPFFHENPDLHTQKNMKYCTSNLQDLTTNLAREYVSDKLMPAAFANNENNNQPCTDLLKVLYGIGENPGRTTVYEWVVK